MVGKGALHAASRQCAHGIYYCKRYKFSKSLEDLVELQQPLHFHPPCTKKLKTNKTKDKKNNIKTTANLRLSFEHVGNPHCTTWRAILHVNKVEQDRGVLSLN